MVWGNCGAPWISWTVSTSSAGSGMGTGAECNIGDSDRKEGASVDSSAIAGAASMVAAMPRPMAAIWQARRRASDRTLRYGMGVKLLANGVGQTGDYT